MIGKLWPFRKCDCKCGNPDCPNTCDNCSYVVVLIACGRRGLHAMGEYDTYGIGLDFNGASTDIGVITDDANLVDCPCRVWVVGDLSGGKCPKIISNLGNDYDTDCIQTLQTTTLNNLVSDVCDEGDPTLASLTIAPGVRTRIDGMQYQIYKACSGDTCCKIQEGLVTVNSRTLPGGTTLVRTLRKLPATGGPRTVPGGTKGHVDWPVPCCVSPPTPPPCGACCICPPSPAVGAYYYSELLLTVAGVYDNPFYLDAAGEYGGPRASCNCNQLNGTFLLRFLPIAPPEQPGYCYYASVEERTNYTDYDSAGFHSIGCYAKTIFDVWGYGSATRHPMYLYSCPVTGTESPVISNFWGANYQPEGGPSGNDPSAPRFGAALIFDPFIPTYIRPVPGDGIGVTIDPNATICSGDPVPLFSYQVQHPTFPLPPMTTINADWLVTPCLVDSNMYQVTLTRFGEAVPCTPEMAMMAAKALEGVVTGVKAMVANQSGPQRGRCAYLGDRTEFIPGCTGRMCRHDCDHPASDLLAKHPVAIPGMNCQTCLHWSDHQERPEEIDGRFPVPLNVVRAWR